MAQLFEKAKRIYGHKNASRMIDLPTNIEMKITGLRVVHTKFGISWMLRILSDGVHIDVWANE